MHKKIEQNNLNPIIWFYPPWFAYKSNVVRIFLPFLFKHYTRFVRDVFHGLFDRLPS